MYIICKGSNLMKRKFLKALSICLLSLCLFSIGVNAGVITPNYADQTVSFSFNTYGRGNGYVDGSLNGVYYSLRPGQCYLETRSFECTDTYTGEYLGWPCYIQLICGSKNYGTQMVTSFNDILVWMTDVNSTKYYIRAYGEKPNCTYTYFGTLHDHLLTYHE